MSYMIVQHTVILLQWYLGLTGTTANETFPFVLL